MKEGLSEKKIGLLENLSSKNQAYRLVIPLVRKKYKKLFDNGRESRLYLKADGHWFSNTRSQPPWQAVECRASNGPSVCFPSIMLKLSLPKTEVLECSTVRRGLLIAKTLNRFAVPA